MGWDGQFGLLLYVQQTGHKYAIWPGSDRDHIVVVNGGDEDYSTKIDSLLPKLSNVTLVF